MFSYFINDLMQYQYLQHALITAIAVGIMCGVLGSFIVLKGMSLMGDAISHAVLPGIAISYMLGINFFVGAVTFGLLTALGIGYIEQNSRIKIDSAIGIMFSAFFALGVILIQKAQSATDLTSILFGNILTVRDSDRYITLVIGGLVLLAVVFFFKELLLVIFDPVMAQSFGLPVKAINYAIVVMLTLVTVATLQTVGVILVVALLITPASTAYLLTDNFKRMIFLSSLFGTISSIIGLYISYMNNIPSGATIVLVAAAIFVLTFLFAPERGLIAKKFTARH